MPKKVLITDDVKVFLELEGSLHRRNVIEILVAQNGAEALEMIRQERPDLVLLDLDMPEMNGDEVCRIVKGEPGLREIPLVLMSHASWEEEIDRARLSGCDDVILKPINREHLIRNIRDLLRIADRAAPRIAVRLSVACGALTEESMLCYTVDLSAGGLFVESDASYPHGTPVNLTLTFPGSAGEVRCRGRVAWVNHPESPQKPIFPPGMGIQFTGLSPESEEFVRAFLESRKE